MPLLTKETKTFNLNTHEGQLISLQIDIEDNKKTELLPYFKRILDAFDKLIRAAELGLPRQVRKALQQVGTSIMTFETQYKKDTYAQQISKKARQILQPVFLKLGPDAKLTPEAIKAFVPKKEKKSWLKRLFE